MWAFYSPGLLKRERRKKTLAHSFYWMSLLYDLLFWFLSSWLTVSKCSNNWLLSKFNSSCLVRGFVDGELLRLLVLLMLFGSPCLWERTVQRSFDWSVCLFELCWHLCVCVCVCVRPWVSEWCWPHWTLSRLTRTCWLFPSKPPAFCSKWVQLGESLRSGAQSQGLLLQA